MPTIQISKIQMRRGLIADLPTPSLDDGEFGFTTDTGRVYIGWADQSVNVEVFTQNTPIGIITQPVLADNQIGFYVSTALSQTGSFLPLQTLVSAIAQDFYLDLAGNGVCAFVYYSIYDTTAAYFIRMGRLTILWNSGMSGSPLCSDDAEVAIGDISDIQWTATLISGPHVILQYTNAYTDNLVVYFRIDRPLP